MYVNFRILGFRSSTISLTLFEKGPHPNSNIQVEKGPHPNSAWIAPIIEFCDTDSKLQSTLLHQRFICYWHIKMSLKYILHQRFI